MKEKYELSNDVKVLPDAKNLGNTHGSRKK